MDLYNKILNIKGQNTENAIIDAIKEVKIKLNNLNYERMCLVYNSYLYEALIKRHVLVHIVDTKDLNATFEHRFLIVFDGQNYYLCDLTYSQFKDDVYLISLLKDGYIKCNNEILNLYLKLILQENKKISIDKVFNSNNMVRR